MTRPLWKDARSVSVVRLRSTELGPGRHLGAPAEENGPDDTTLLTIESVDEKPVGIAIRGDLEHFAQKVVEAVYGPNAEIIERHQSSFTTDAERAPELIYVSPYGHGISFLNRPNAHDFLPFNDGLDRMMAVTLLEDALAKLLPEGHEPRLFRKTTPN